MALTLRDITPVGLCIATQNLFDAKRFQANFCDNMLLRVKDKNLEKYLVPLKREMNSSQTQKKYLDGHKAVIIDNMDKILSLVFSHYSQIDLRSVQSIISDGKELMQKILNADSFESISALEPIFRGRITLPTYSLFIESMRRSNVTVL